MGLRADTPGELARALDEARAAERSVVIHVRVEAAAALPSSAWWDVPVAEVSEEAGVQDARRRWTEAAATRRWYGGGG